MSAADQLEDTFPHGSLEGYHRGCKGSRCAGLISCRDVYRRYAGDFGFKRAIDAGTPLEEIIRQDQGRLESIRQRDRVAARQQDQATAPASARSKTPSTQRATKNPQRAARAPRPAPTARPARKPAPATAPRIDHTAAVLDAHDEQLHDEAIAARLSIPISAVERIRRGASRPPHRAPRAHVEPSWAAAVRQLHEGGATDPQIADALGVDVHAAGRYRRRLKLPVNRVRTAQPKTERAPKVDHSPEITRLHGLQKTDAEMSDEIGIPVAKVGILRRGLQLTAHRPVRTPKPKKKSTPRVDHSEAITELHAQRKTDSEIGAALGLSKSRVGELRRGLELPANVVRKNRWEGVELQPCGTNASYARGCRCPECHEAHKTFARTYITTRKAQGIEDEHHGSAYGYQLGCRDRETCPSDMTCTDALLEEERRRRREAGIAEQAPRVPAQPVRDHVRTLIDSGVAVLTIAAIAEVSTSGLRTLMYGRSGTRRGELPAHIEKSKAERLLALKPASEPALQQA